MDKRPPDKHVSKETARKNKRLAITLALVALGFYVGFILLQMNK